MDMAMDSMSGMSGMQMSFFNSHTTNLFSDHWKPTTSAGYAGTCIFLILFATILRSLLAFKSYLENRWEAQALNGVEENVKDGEAQGKRTPPFRLSVDVPRALLDGLMAGVGYLL